MGDEQVIELEPLRHASLAQRVAIMNAAYADYFVPVRVTPEQIAAMDAFYDIDLDLSVIARTRWEPVGMALLARRGARAWVSGVGVMPAWRRRGVAWQMMTRLIAEARSAGTQVIFLEVISQNKAALTLYRRLGFTLGRELLTWQRPAEADPLPIPPERLIATPAQELLDAYGAWRLDEPCWQRAPDTLRRMDSRLKGYRLDWKGVPTAYCLVSQADDTITLMDVVANPQADLLLPGRILLQALSGLYFGRPLSIMNVPADDRLNRILAALGFLVTVRQQEMHLG